MQLTQPYCAEQVSFCVDISDNRQGDIKDEHITTSGFKQKQTVDI